MLSEKAQRFVHMTLRSIIFFAVLGAVVLLVAVHFVEKMFNDTIREATGISQQSQTPSPTPAK